MSFKKKLALEASAGSGKTFALSIRYVSLLFLGAKPESILTLTFTNKASTEMSERISSLLKNLPNKDIELKEISKLTNLSEDKLLLKQPKIYKEFLSSNLNISTIDKFNTQILRSFSLYLSLMPDFQIGQVVSEHEELKTFIKEIKKHGLYHDVIEFSVYEQKRLKDIFGYLNILKQKQNELDGLSIEEYDISTLKPKILKTFYDLKEIFLSCSTLSESAKKSLEIKELEDLLSKTWLEKDSLEEYRYFKKCFTPRADELFLELKNHLKEYLRAKESFYKKKYFEIFEIYKEVKKKINLKTNTLAFDDVTNFVYELLRGGKIESEFLYFRLDSRIDHILIDEFQDTSITQFKILEPLIEEINSGTGVKEFKSFFYVGDTKQSIYRFRGGVKELFYYVRELYDVTMDKLYTNYRSSKNVVEFVNQVFQNKIKGYTPQLVNSKDEGYVKVVEKEEILDMIVEEVGFLLENGVSEDDIAILTYANDDAFVIEEVLLKEYPTLNITTTTTQKLINTQTVRAVLEFLKYLYFDEKLYLSNFLALIGEELEKEVDRKQFNINKELHLLIKDIVNYFDIFSYDENILKLIEISADFKDIDEFVFGCEDIEEVSPLKKQTGVKILTIHKSKGLEFPHLIVADRFKKKPANTSHFIFDYDGVKLQELYLRSSKREYLDDGYKEALERQKLYEKDDELNTLYVALTRAKNSLILCQKEKNSSLKLLGLSCIERGKVIPSSTVKKEKSFDEFDYESIKTGFQDKKNKTEEEQQDINAINFGLALHYMLESMADFTDKSLEEAFWSMKNRFEIKLQKDQSIIIKNRVQNLIQNQPFLDLVSGTFYKETALSFEGEIKQVDLLVEKDDKYIVIDYKSSDFVQTKHIKQVSHYKKALTAILDKKVEGYVCYIRDSEVEILKV